MQIGADQHGDRALAGAPPRLRRVVLDVTSEASIGAAVDHIGGRLDGAGLDGVVNNAGVAIPGPLDAVGLDDLRRQLEVNVIGQIAVTQATLPLIRQASGRLVFVGSIGGLLASQFAGADHASKFAIEAIADVWRQELDPEGIDVILIEPSVISTPIWEKAIAYLDDLGSGVSPRLAPYRNRLHAFRESLERAEEHGKSADDVAEVIAEALTTKRPDTRYVVGGAGKLATALRPLVPDRLADKLAERTTSPWVSRWRLPVIRSPRTLRERGHGDAQLSALIAHAAAVVTLTPGAARAIAVRWGVVAEQLPHPHVVEWDFMARPRAARDGFVVGLHAKGLRANMDVLGVAEVLASAVAELPGGRLRLDVRDEIFEPGAYFYAPDVGDSLRRLAADHDAVDSCGSVMTARGRPSVESPATGCLVL